MSKSLYIDPGHGGSDPGANGYGVLEKTWNLRISKYQYDRLKSMGARVTLGRSSDVTQNSTARTSRIRSKYDYCISNHWNAFNGIARGVETIHSVYASSTIARRIANAIVDESGLPFRRVFSRKNNSGGDYYYMHRLTGTTTTIIIEYGFIDNKQDNDFYRNDDNFYRVAERVVKEMCSILGVKYVPLKEDDELASKEYNELNKKINALTRQVNTLVSELNRKLDVPSNSQEAGESHKEHWEKLKKDGITVGTNPKKYSTREQVGTMIVRAVEKYVDKSNK